MSHIAGSQVSGLSKGPYNAYGQSARPSAWRVMCERLDLHRVQMGLLAMQAKLMQASNPTADFRCTRSAAKAETAATEAGSQLLCRLPG